jgi:hypothetical protein
MSTILPGKKFDFRLQIAQAIGISELAFAGWAGARPPRVWPFCNSADEGDVKAVDKTPRATLKGVGRRW